MKYVTMAISLKVKGPLLTQSSSPGELGLDSVVARHKDKTPYLPGTLITGKLRQSLEELQSIDPTLNIQLNDWLGESSSNSIPKNKRLFFSDFDLNKKDYEKLKPDHIRDRITVNPETGAVEEQHIVMMENPFISGKKYTFTGNLHFFAADSQVKEILEQIKTGFNWISQLGSMKSIGFGQISKVSFSDESLKAIPEPEKNTQDPPLKIGLIIKPRYPLCMSNHARKDSNLFESSAIISGGAIIGSIATTWNHLLGKTGGEVTKSLDNTRSLLCENFSKLHVSHAFPAQLLPLAKRPVVAPLSLCKVSKDTENYYDVAQLSSPCLIEITTHESGKTEISQEPLDFSLDWKTNHAPQQCYPWPYIRLSDWGWASVSTDLRVRTKIDPVSKRSSEGELFAYELIVPNYQGGDAFAWYAELDLSRVSITDRPVVFNQLKSLLAQGITGLSKTNTPAEIEFITDELHTVYKTAQIEENSLWIVTLQTDTLLGTPENLDFKSGKTELETMYQKAWKELSDDKLKLVRYFARQKLSGGEYRKNVFQKTDLYRPWFLTEAGSVFVLQANDKKEVKMLLENWHQQGLPLTKSSLEYYNISQDENQQWQDCPFIPQNGYGEIAINIDMPENIIKLDDKHPQVKSIQLEEA